MMLKSLSQAAVVSCLAVQTAALTIRGKPNQLIKPYKRELLQNFVTWDEHSLFVHGERVLFYSGEFHPFRLPVPSLYLDVFQKIRAMGYTGVSFYVDWALLEGKPGHFSAEGIFSLEPFFDAASKAGIYLLARPGPYINAEASGGGFPGWLQRIKGLLRTAAPDYLHATDFYAKSIGEIIAKAQITNGGPVILVQPENEYTGALSNTKFPDPAYMQYVENQLRNAGIVVPFISNDASPSGHNSPGTGEGEVDIYGHDGYPLGFDCANPYTWPSGNLPTNWYMLHEQQSPTTPYSIVEFQGGSFDPWGGLGFAQCADLLNYEFERVFYKNDFSFGVTIFNIYMTYGGTNWGNLGHPGGYTSYDYGAVITEERQIYREKYSEAKLEANMLQSSPAYWTADVGTPSTSAYTTSRALYVTPLTSNSTKFFVVRHATYSSLDSTSYKLTIPTSAGSLTIPQISGSLTLNGRDSKIHVSDYDVGGMSLLYSTAEVFTWKRYDSKIILVVYGGPEETHELAFTKGPTAKVTEGSGVKVMKKSGATVLNFKASVDRKVVKVGENLFVYLLDRNSAYNYWVVPASPEPVVVKAGYLVRTASVQGRTLSLTGDVNATTSVEVIGAPKSVSSVSFNGAPLRPVYDHVTGALTATVQYKKPSFKIPRLSSLKWKYIDNLPEIQPGYSDASWTVADHKTSNNTVRNITTPTSLYASDYGYNTGSLLYRGHFIANGDETTLHLETQGGSAFGMSTWLDSKYLGSWKGYAVASSGNNTFTIPTLKKGSKHIITVLVDHMGLDENWVIGSESMKNPRGILNYKLSGHAATDVTWKLTGNLGGEDYADHVRGPLNEGGMYAERQGYHLPGAPTQSWKNSKGPTAGISGAGVAFYATTFDLEMPEGYDIPLSFSFANSSSSTGSESNSTAYRVQLFVNGYQFGKYVHNVGPQDSFPVPQGIFNYNGSNYIAMTFWSLASSGAKVDGLELVVGSQVQWGYGKVEMAPIGKWQKRAGAY